MSSTPTADFTVELSYFQVCYLNSSARLRYRQLVWTEQTEWTIKGFQDIKIRKAPWDDSASKRTPRWRLHSCEKASEHSQNWYPLFSSLWEFFLSALLSVEDVLTETCMASCTDMRLAFRGPSCCKFELCGFELGEFEIPSAHSTHDRCRRFSWVWAQGSWDRQRLNVGAACTCPRVSWAQYSDPWHPHSEWNFC